MDNGIGWVSEMNHGNIRDSEALWTNLHALLWKSAKTPGVAVKPKDIAEEILDT